eukprot:31419-Pelagococcus_subviridis.AAC.24
MSVLPTIAAASLEGASSFVAATPVTSQREYESLSLTATAAFAGIVHGVVVHTARLAFFSFSLCSAGKFAASSSALIGNATYTDVDTCPSGYSSSAWVELKGVS